MPNSFKLVEEKFSKVDNEWQRTYLINFDFAFNKRIITYLTITNYYQTKPGREMITDELILKLLTKMNGESLKSMKYGGAREPYEWETFYQSKPYVLFFWFKDGTNNHLWVRNCHRIDY